MSLCVCVFLFLSHAVWTAVGPSGYHSADDQQLTEGQRHTAHTGTLVFDDQFLTGFSLLILKCISILFLLYSALYTQVQQTMKENLVSVEENFAALDQRMKKLSK